MPTTTIACWRWFSALPEPVENQRTRAFMPSWYEHKSQHFTVGFRVMIQLCQSIYKHIQPLVLELITPARANNERIDRHWMPQHSLGNGEQL